MTTKPCIVCAYPVEIAESRMEVYKDYDAEPDGNVSVLAICGSKRCQRLFREAVAEEGRHQRVS